jgi:hypothetical protein
MSSVVIAGDTSGTVTLDAPAVAGSTVITLPASGGSLFTQGNILGTVSQSSGVPTGAIIESGSNANGAYVKYADGTMICYMSNQTTPVANTLTSSTHSFPSTFSAAPILSCAVDTSVLGTTVTAMTARSATTTQYSQTILRSNTTATGLSVIAIGRWF